MSSIPQNTTNQKEPNKTSWTGKRVLMLVVGIWASSAMIFDLIRPDEPCVGTTAFCVGRFAGKIATYIIGIAGIALLVSSIRGVRRK